MDHETANGADFMGNSPVDMNNPVNGLSSPGINIILTCSLDRGGQLYSSAENISSF
jgi:hypothetical protein